MNDYGEFVFCQERMMFLLTKIDSFLWMQGVMGDRRVSLRSIGNATEISMI